MSVTHIGVLYKRFPMAVEPRDMGNALSLSCSLPGVFQPHKTSSENTNLSLLSPVHSIPQPPS